MMGRSSTVGRTARRNAGSPVRGVGVARHFAVLRRCVMGRFWRDLLPTVQFSKTRQRQQQACESDEEQGVRARRAAPAGEEEGEMPMKLNHESLWPLCLLL